MTDKPDPQKRRSVLDMPADEFRSLGHDLIDRIADFYASLPERALTAEAGEVPGMFAGQTLPEHGSPAADLLDQLTPLAFDQSLHNGHPLFLGYITSSAAPIGALADLLAAALNANLAKHELAPLASEIETQTIAWLADLIGYAQGCGGLMVSGGNMANFHAFVAARRARAPWDIRSDGNYADSQRLTAYVSAETHTWIDKASDVCGLGSEGIRWIETDRAGRMRLDLLRQAIAADRKSGRLPFIVVGTAGTVGTGVIDPLREMGELCRDEDLWFHVDGAYGAPAACLPEAPDDLRALELADSVALDPHKWLYCPIEAACVLTRDRNALRDAFSFSPSYYSYGAQRADRPDFYELGMQNTRGFRALKVWLALRLAGREGYRQSIRDDIRLAERLYRLADQHAEFEANSVNLSIATFRFVPDGLRHSDSPVAEAYLNELNRTLLAEIQASGRLFLSNAIVSGRYLLRACIVNFRTSDDDIDALPETIAKLGRALDARLRPGRLRE